jgi:hypothetical protein
LLMAKDIVFSTGQKSTSKLTVSSHLKNEFE